MHGKTLTGKESDGLKAGRCFFQSSFINRKENEMNKEQEKKLNDILFTLDIMKDTCHIAIISSDSKEIVNRAIEDVNNLEEVKEIVKKHYEVDIWRELVNYHNYVMDILEDEYSDHGLATLKNARVRIASYFEDKFLLKHERR